MVPMFRDSFVDWTHQVHDLVFTRQYWSTIGVIYQLVWLILGHFLVEKPVVLNWFVVSLEWTQFIWVLCGILFIS